MDADLRPPAVLTESDESSGSTNDSEAEDEPSWIAWFCSIRGNDFFCEVDEEYVHDEFNLTGLSSEVPYYEYALDTILDAESPNSEVLTEEQQETVDAAAELLYGLIHARYILSAKGLAAMMAKFEREEFGSCGRVQCEQQALLPVGQSDQIRQHTVALFCPRCQEIYMPRSSRHLNIDGAYFGTTFPHLFLMTYPQFNPPAGSARGAYVPRVFGFRIHKGFPSHSPLALTAVAGADATTPSSAGAEGGAAGAAAGVAGGGSGTAASRAGASPSSSSAQQQQQQQTAGKKAAAGEGGVTGASSGAAGASGSLQQKGGKVGGAAAGSFARGASSGAVAGAAGAVAGAGAGAAAGGGGGASAGGAVGSAGPSMMPRRDLTTVLPVAEFSAGRIVGRDGRLLSPEDDFFDEEDAPTRGRVQGSAGGGAGGGAGGAAGSEGAARDDSGVADIAAGVSRLGVR